MEKLFAKQDAHWDRWFANRDAKQAEPLSASSMQPGAAAEREVLVPTTAGMAEVPDIEPTDEIRTSVVDFEPSDEIHFDGCLIPAVVAPTESVAVFPIAACVAPVPESCLTSTGVVSVQSELPAPASVATTSSAIADAAAAPAVPPEGPDAGRVVPLVAHVTSTAAGATEIVDSVGALSTSQPQPGAAALLQVTLPSIIVLPVSLVRCLVSALPAEPAGRLLLGHAAASLVPTRTASCFPAPAARGAAQDDSTRTMATKCLMPVHNNGITLLVSPTSCGSSLGTNNHNAKVCVDLLASSMQLPRYITAMSPCLSTSIVLKCVVIGAHEYETMLDCMPIHQNTIMFGPVCAYVFDMEKWPPPIHLDLQRTEVQVRPTPWPSFGYWNADGASFLHNKKDRDFMLWISWKIPWPFFLKYYVVVLHWVKLLAMEVIDSETEVEILGFCQLNVLFKAPWPPPDGSQFLGCQYLDWYLIQKKRCGVMAYLY
ncbi:unnamed protein product [Urochloa humidicola]